MSTTETIVAPRSRFDEEGRLIPLTAEEKVQHAAAIRAAIDALEAIPDDPTEDDAEFYRAIDSHRPHRPLFEGLY